MSDSVTNVVYVVNPNSSETVTANIDAAISPRPYGAGAAVVADWSLS